MLIDTLKWRIEFKVDEILKEEFPEDVFGNVGYIYGKDKGSRPVTYVGNTPVRYAFTNCVLICDAQI